MEKRTTHGYIWMGTGARFLRDVGEKWPIFGKGYVLTNIESLMGYLREYDMHVTARVASRLEEFRDDRIGELLAARDADPETDFEATRVLTRDEAEFITATAESVQTTMLAEAEGQVAFITRDKRFPVDRLLDNVGSLMPAGVFQSLPDLARHDFTEAGRCIAFEVPTAAAFHLMRGTESVLRDFYLRLVKQKRVDPLMWGPITAHLRRRRHPPEEVLMNNLDNIRRSFRNPTQHPEKVYDVDEAQDLMSLSVDVVTRMQRHLKRVGR